MSGVADRIRRKRPVLSVSIDPYLANKVEEVAEAKGMSKSRVAEIALPLGVARSDELHGRRLSDGGPDDPRWVVAICPTCHRRAHYAVDGMDYNKKLMATANKAEG